MKSKTIIISSQTKGEGRGILTLTQENGILKCKLRLYNVEKLNRYAKIGIYHNDEVSVANLLDRGGFYESSFAGDFDMDGDFYSAIIKTDCNNEVLLAGGTYAGYYFNNTDEQQNCENCTYKQTFYEEKDENLIKLEENPQKNAQICENSEENDKTDETKSEEPKKVTPSILEQILPQLKFIFEHNQPNDELNNLIETGKFVSMPNGEYSLGAIYENEEVKFICYAVKSKYNVPPSEELGKNYQWLPLDKDDPLSDGYYIVFQDAKDLKIIEF